MASTRVIILGAGRPVDGTDPSALLNTSDGQRVLDWILEAFRTGLEAPKIHFVGGYRMGEVVEAYPDLHYTRNDAWDQTGTLGSLLSAPFDADYATYVCYADVVFTHRIVEELSDCTEDAGTVIDTTWKRRYASRSKDNLRQAEKVTTDGENIKLMGKNVRIDEADAEFVGLLKLSPETVERTQTLVREGRLSKQADLPTLCEELINRGVTLDTVDANGDWAEIESKEDLARFVLDTKANTLRRLETAVSEATIQDQFTFRVDRWETDPEGTLQSIQSKFGERSVIVRSSAVNEDGWTRSNAGQFESVLDIQPSDRSQLESAIHRVIESYDGNPANQVLVQPMVTEVKHSGVVMTRTLDHGGPYYVVNYDEFASSTESVTNGAGEELKTVFIRKDAVDSDDHTGQSVVSQAGQGNPFLHRLITAVQEIENAIGYDRLDIEFAINTEGKIRILQARPITTDSAGLEPPDNEVYNAVDSAQKAFVDAQSPPPGVVGDRTVFGVMPDWNPAEIIGRRPRLLADSLYRYLIMDEVWARQRAEYGYRDVRPHPLMKSFGGQPYVDVRAVFNSFVPRSVSEPLAERLVEHYLDRLERNPELHDKIEFDVALTCLTFDFERRAEPLIEAGFSAEELSELRDGLREISQEAIERTPTDVDRIDTVAQRFERLDDADLPPLRTARCHLEDCRRVGTITFAHLARSAFVAVSMLRSLRRKGVLTDNQVSNFLESLTTITRQFEADAYRVATGELSWEEFVEEYGHLRPGTYDITSPAYASEPETYLRPVVASACQQPETVDPIEVWDSETKRAVEDELERVGLSLPIEAFVEFLTAAIEGREYAKFVFSRNLSAALEEIAAFGREHGLTRAQLAHIPVEDLFRVLHNDPPTDTTEWLERRAMEGREHHQVTNAIELPPLITDRTQFSIFERPSRSPNFVTEQSVTSETTEIEDGSTTPETLDGKIVMIRQADPGYDWLFGHDIAGLITMYGGTNSHMAIRAAESSIPAAIGVGEEMYQQLSQADVVRLDCSGMNLEGVR